MCGKKYPEDVKYNCCQIGQNVVHHFSYTDEVILKKIQEKNWKKISVSQGYTNCSIAVISENAVIVTDKIIAEVLGKNEMDVLYLPEKLDIKLLDENEQYSTMQGLIGGAMAQIEDKIVIFGDLRKIDSEHKIREFIESHHQKVVDFEGLDVIDYGGLICL